MIYYEQNDKILVIPSGFTTKSYRDGYNAGFDAGYEKAWDEAHADENQ